MARILVVEDDEDCRRILALLLIRSGHAVVGVESVPEAVAQLRSVPQIVLLDLMLPGVYGLALLAHLRGLVPPPRVAFISANIPPIIDDYLPAPVSFRKPIDFNRVIRWIDNPSSHLPEPSNRST